MCGASCVPHTRDLAHHPGTCPDWESNQWPFVSQASAQSAELHQSGLFIVFWGFLYACKIDWPLNSTSFLQYVGMIPQMNESNFSPSSSLGIIEKWNFSFLKAMQAKLGQFFIYGNHHNYLYMDNFCECCRKMSQDTFKLQTKKIHQIVIACLPSKKML